MSTWLAIGAFIQSGLFLALGRISLFIPIVYLLSKTISSLLMTKGIIANPYMANVLPGKFSAQMPNNDGSYGPLPASKSVTVFLLGARSNHPMGILAPNFKEVGEAMAAMQKDIAARAEEYDFLGSSSWLGAERASGNDIMNVMYFSSPEGLHKFAHDDLHLKTWSKYAKMYAEAPHFSIWHEVFTAPAGKWETIYANSHPTLFGAASAPVKTEKGTVWQSTVVDASRGVLKSSRGRMGNTDGLENDKYGLEVYETLKPIA